MFPKTKSATQANKRPDIKPGSSKPVAINDNFSTGQTARQNYIAVEIIK